MSTGIQDHAQLYLTLAQVALDILPCQASSVPCECLFLSSKQVATDQRSLLGMDQLEHVLIMKSAWQGLIVDRVAVNLEVVEEVNEYIDLLQADTDAKGWEIEDNQFILESDSDLD